MRMRERLDEDERKMRPMATSRENGDTSARTAGAEWECQGDLLDAVEQKECTVGTWVGATVGRGGAFSTQSFSARREFTIPIMTCTCPPRRRSRRRSRG